MSDAPAQLREILAKRLLDQLQVRLVNRAPDLAERFGEELRTVPLSGEE